mgnify:CR=1 FL=1
MKNFISDQISNKLIKFYKEFNEAQEGKWLNDSKIKRYLNLIFFMINKFSLCHIKILNYLKYYLLIVFYQRILINDKFYF